MRFTAIRSITAFARSLMSSGWQTSMRINRGTVYCGRTDQKAELPCPVQFSLDDTVIGLVVMRVDVEDGVLVVYFTSLNEATVQFDCSRALLDAFDGTTVAAPIEEAAKPPMLIVNAAPPPRTSAPTKAGMSDEEARRRLMSEPDEPGISVEAISVQIPSLPTPAEGTRRATVGALLESGEIRH